MFFNTNFLTKSPDTFFFNSKNELKSLCKLSEKEISKAFKEFIIDRESIDVNEINEDSDEAEFFSERNFENFKLKEEKENIYFLNYENFGFSGLEKIKESKIKDLNFLDAPTNLPIVSYNKEKEKNNNANNNINIIEDNKEVFEKLTSSQVINNKISERFKTQVIVYQNGKLLERKKRKYKPDDIRKKIKSRFHKYLKNKINENLIKAGSIKIFDFLPQIFISSISREKNRDILNLTYRQILERDFSNEFDDKNYKNKKIDIEKYNTNIDVLQYLDKNPQICKKSGFDVISKMKYKDLLNTYFNSKDFEKSVEKLRQENEEEEYISEYLSKAKDYVNFFSSKPIENIEREKVLLKKKRKTSEIFGSFKDKILI